MNKKILSLMVAFLLVFATPVFAGFGTNSVRIQKNYKEDIDVTFLGKEYNKEDVSSRYKFEAIESNGRIRFNGNLVVYGKGFNIQLKNLKAVSKTETSAAKKSFMKEGKTFFVLEGENAETTYENVIDKEGKRFSIYAKTDAVGYMDNRRFNEKGILKYVYEDNKLRVFTERGELILSL